MNLPVFEMIISNEENSDVEVSFVALVDKPAIEKNFLAFGAIPLNFKLNTEKRIISGPAMVADSLIYRKDENGEYNVFFSKETIRDIAIKFFKKDYQKNLNLFHDPSLSLEGVTIFESFVSDTDRGVQPMKGFEDLPDGTWFISAKVENDDVWAKIKSGEVKGFSVEGIFSYVKKGQQTMEEAIYQLLSGTLENKSLFNKTDVMTSIKDMLKEFKQKFLGELPQVAPEQNLSEQTLMDGTAVSITEMAVGGVVTVGDVPVPAGDYELSDGTKFSVGEGGVITAIGEVAPEEAAPEAPADYSSKFAAYDEKFTAYEQKFADQEGMLNKLSTSFAKTNETIVHLVGIIEKMAAEPTADPVNAQNSFQSQKSQSKEESRKEFAKLFTKIKNK